MRWVWLLAVFSLAAGSARGQQAGAATQAAAAVGGLAQTPQTVKVYEPSKPVTEPRLLPPAEPADFPKDCTDAMEGESELSLLVDTSGQPRNLMFLRPSGTIADRFAIVIANGDRFAPGTLDGKPVVVAETLDVKMEACIGLVKDAAGTMESGWVLKSTPKQKLKKPKNPPQVANLAPPNAPAAVNVRMVKRPDFFGNGESAPVVIYSEYADYTPTHPGTKGSCEVSLMVDAHGLPEDLHVLKKLDPGLDRSALAAVEKYRFFPAIKADEPVPAAVVVSVDFAPPRE